MTRLNNPEMSLQDMIVEMSGGNPGAFTAIMHLVRTAESVDPDSALGPFSPILSLDTNEIYDGKIWGLYKDVCGEDPVKTHACLRAVQLGIISKHDLHKAIINREQQLNAGELVSIVQERLPNFAKGYVDPVQASQSDNQGDAQGSPQTPSGGPS